MTRVWSQRLALDLRLSTLDSLLNMTDLQRLKLDALKEFAYGASHEINNPLANIAARAQTLLRDETHPERRRALEAIYEQAMRAHEMIADLMLFARPPKLELQVVDLGDLVSLVLSSLSSQAKERKIEIACHYQEEKIELEADPVQLMAAMRAVCMNALEAIGREGTVTVTFGCTAGRAEIEIADTGPGISPAALAHLFDPFFSGRESGRGLGFGLSKCWRIVTEHGGNIEIESEEGQGAKFRIQLPIHPGESK